MQRLDPAAFHLCGQERQFGGAWITLMSFMNASPATLYSSAVPVRVPNTLHFESPRYATLIEQSAVETDDQKLKAEMRELTQITLDEAFVLPIAEAPSLLSPGPVVTRATVKNVTWDDWGWPAYQDIWLEA